LRWSDNDEDAGAIGRARRTTCGRAAVARRQLKAADPVRRHQDPVPAPRRLDLRDGLPRSASVVAVRDTVLSRLSRAEFDAFAEKHPELYKSLITLLTQRLRETNVAVAAGSFLSLQGRVALTLLELADHFGRNVGSDRIVVQHKIGQSDLAAMTGIARENLSRILKDWERRKIVSRLSGYYCLENKSKLQREVRQL
jgi:CRP-like cAMP-binding protein